LPLLHALRIGYNSDMERLGMRTLLLSLGALLLVAFLYWHFQSHVPIRNYPSSGTDIVAYGDSLVWGQGSTLGHDFVSDLSRKIGQPVVNLGVPGETTALGIAGLHGLDIYQPKVVLLLLGGNDYLQRVPIDTTFANLGKIIENIQSRGAIILLLGVRGGVLLDHFAPRYEALSRQYGTAYVPDVLDGLIGHTQFMSDEVHPNDAGYQIIADRIYPVLAPLLQ
jgi:lysophospholipase L1-like esterase